MYKILNLSALLSLLFTIPFISKAEVISPHEAIKAELITITNTSYIQNEINKLGSKKCKLNENSEPRLDIEYRFALLADRDYLTSLKDDPNSQNELSIVLETLEKWPHYAEKKYYFTIQCEDKKIYDLIFWDIVEKNKPRKLKLHSITELKTK